MHAFGLEMEEVIYLTVSMLSWHIWGILIVSSNVHMRKRIKRNLSKKRFFFFLQKYLSNGWLIFKNKLLIVSSNLHMRKRIKRDLSKNDQKYLLNGWLVFQFHFLCLKIMHIYTVHNPIIQHVKIERDFFRNPWKNLDTR